MDKNTYKILRFYNTHPNESYSVSTLAKCFPNIPTSDLREMISLLYENDYLRFLGDAKFQATNKGKTYKSVNRKNWLAEHLVETIALIFAISSFGLSVFSIVYSILTRQSLIQ